MIEINHTKEGAKYAKEHFKKFGGMDGKAKSHALESKKYKTLMGTPTNVKPSKERQYHIDSINRKGTKFK